MNATRDRHSETIAEEAAQWVVQLGAVELSADERREFVAWLKRSPLHIAEYLRAERTWADLGSVDAARRIDIAQLLAAEDSNVIELQPQAPSAPPKRRSAGAMLAFAASAALAFIGLVWFQAYFFERYTTGVGEQRTLKLADGSTVVLNTGTGIRVDYGERVRQIHLLEGEALFDVAKDPARPFLVRSDRAVVRAVGTSFVVRRRDARTEVTVIEGEVAVARSAEYLEASIPPQAVRVAAGVRAEVAERNISTSTVINQTAVTAWRSGRLIFDGETLGEVVAEFNRYNELELTVTDPELANERISGVFDADRPRVLVRFLEQSGAIEPVPEAASHLALTPRR